MTSSTQPFVPQPLRSIEETGLPESFLSDLVLPSRVLDQVGPAIRSGRSVFLFGPPGNGKTSIAERMAWLLGGAVYLPHAIEHDGQVIKFFDPLYHVALESDDGRMDER